MQEPSPRRPLEEVGIPRLLREPKRDFSLPIWLPVPSAQPELQAACPGVRIDKGTATHHLIKEPYPINVGRDPLPRAEPPNQDVDTVLPQVCVGRGQEGPRGLP